MRKLLTAFITFQLVFSPTISWSVTKTGNDQSSNNTTLNTPDSSQEILPAVNYSIQGVDEETGKEFKIDIVHGETDTPAEFEAAKAYLQKELTDAKARGEQTSLTLMTTSASIANEFVPNPEEWGVDHKDISKISLNIPALKELSRTLDTRDVAQSAQEKKSFRKRLKERFDAYLHSLSNDDVNNPFHKLSLRIGLTGSQATVPKETATFSYIRFFTTGSIVAAAYMANTALGLPGLGIAFSAIYMGGLSAAVQWNKIPYLRLFEKNGPVSWVIRSPLKAYKALGLSSEEVEALDRRIQNTAAHYHLNAAGNFVLTETIFLAPPIIVFALMGASFYPDLYQPIGPITDYNTLVEIADRIAKTNYEAIENMIKVISLVSTEVLYASVKAYTTQGIWDIANSQKTHAEEMSLVKELRDNEIEIDAFETRMRKVKFSAAFKLIGISMASNLGVVLGLPDDEYMKMVGDTIVGGLTFFGLSYLGYVSLKYGNALAILEKRFPKLTAHGKDAAQSIQDKLKCVGLLRDKDK